LVLSRVTSVIHLSVDGLASAHLATAVRSEPDRYPNFLKLMSDGAYTLNARCDYSSSLTVPNHLSMLTGRPVIQPAGQANTVPHGYTLDSTPSGTTTVHNSGNTNVPYKASVLDVIHDHGLRTAVYLGKTTLAVCVQSYDAANGAPDLIPPDNGEAKIDFPFVADCAAASIVDRFLPTLTSSQPNNFAFLHFEDLDSVGHFYGWGSAAWFDRLASVDSLLGRLLSAVETNVNAAVAVETVVIVTADHGGQASNHLDPSLPGVYTIPLFVWGPGFSGGENLYARFVNRADPGTNRLDYDALSQPLRNGDTGNLALSLLGMPAIPGSTLNPLLPAGAPALVVVHNASVASLEWPLAAAGFTLEGTDSLGPGAQWTSITDGVVTNAAKLSYSIPGNAGSRFFRLRR
jgi:hypothetical protein